MFKKILIANRSEIAVRVIRACREMGIKSVAVYSEADRESRHVLMADESVCIGPGPSKLSYLDQEAILTAAKITGADAIHPGYGFLSENADFSELCAKRGIVFIGPPPEASRKLGFKSAGKAVALAAKVPVVPGTKGDITTDVSAEAAEIGYPVLIKASAGGGGKGMRVVREPGELKSQLQAAATEAKAAFGDGSVFIEKLLERPRHVEIQIIADKFGNVVAFPERDCTVQRRHQKLVEESPSPALTPEIRRDMQAAAVRLAKAANYSNVGTVEFLFQDGKFYFIEVNARLQVEHPVTELVAGVDLMEMMIRVAAGEKLSIDQERASQIRCHAIEHRINAEDPDNGFMPCPGRIESLELPGGAGVRVDTHAYAGYTIPSYYDSMIAKLIISAADRPTALRRSLRALGELKVGGIKTTAGMHAKVVAHPVFMSGDFDTHFIEKTGLLDKKEPVAA
ncbi:MAG: acetyl-CoA carboxylase biotin carboxylase subunit [Elusimicrobia bacterium]|nr:acetyl-CoA carboxylase biotin carboxylase subunit [Elusimicrobiota bacterium]MDE2510645.1 acetyl-CoA carboxylase biotin carboxylase subunit [Elusimicrobiota bacterium]